MRIESFGLSAMSMAALFFASPHFFVPPFVPKTQVEPICNSTTHKKWFCDEKLKVSSLKNFRWVFWAAVSIFGMGCSPIYSLGTAYVDENSSQSKGYFYFGEWTNSFFLPSNGDERIH